MQLTQKGCYPALPLFLQLLLTFPIAAEHGVEPQELMDCALEYNRVPTNHASWRNLLVSYSTSLVVFSIRLCVLKAVKDLAVALVDAMDAPEVPQVSSMPQV